MHKLVVLYPEPADPGHFRDYYVKTHLPLVARMPGLLAWRYSFEVAATQGQPPYFAVFEAEFADAAAMAAARESPQGKRVTADVANYATGGAVVLHYPVHPLSYRLRSAANRVANTAPTAASAPSAAAPNA